jgi:hypothetical protein
LRRPPYLEGHVVGGRRDDVLVERVEVEVQSGALVARERRDRGVDAAGLVVLENAFTPRHAQYVKRGAESTAAAFTERERDGIARRWVGGGGGEGNLSNRGEYRWGHRRPRAPLQRTWCCP